MQIEPTEQERQLLSILREWGEKDHYRLVIEFNDGAWEIEIYSAIAWTRGDARRRLKFRHCLGRNGSRVGVTV